LRLVVGITGASGAVYSWRLLQELNRRKVETLAIMTRNAEKILKCELGKTPEDIYGLATEHYDIDDLTASVASGSQPFDGMIVVPCSMGSVAAIAGGVSRNLLLRVAEVCIKEGRPLILVPRESPVSVIHLENLLKLSRAGVIIMPACPGFYHRPKTIEALVDFMVGRILVRLGFEQDLFEPWRGNVT
jgi:4-hydroxy-3-polyprenylbenzoate decarboxylase